MLNASLFVSDPLRTWTL